MINFKDMDKSDFECWQIDGGSVYYGQVAYIDDSNNLVEDTEEAKKIALQKHQEETPEGEELEFVEPKFKKVRHGLGIN